MKIAGKKREMELKRLQAVQEEIERERYSIKRVFEAEDEVRKTLMLLNSQLVKLNELNAIHNRGAVDIEDLCYHHLYSQEKFDEDYKVGRAKERERFLKQHPEFAKQDEQPNDEQED